MEGKTQALVIAVLVLMAVFMVLSLPASQPPTPPKAPAGLPSPAQAVPFPATAAQATQAPSASSLPDLGPVPEFTGLQQWFNSPPLSMKGLQGKVVLVDFWTYSCINCLRTLPYLKQWDEKYRAKGLVIVGIHSPEFDFEKKPENVQMALQQQGIQYPVALDNDHATWDAFQNLYWPHEYLVDKDGRLRHDHVGEGAYDETEADIQALLGEGGPMASAPPEAAGMDLSKVVTPELYVGSDRLDPATKDLVGFQGNWQQLPDSMALTEDLGIARLTFNAKTVHMVAEAPGGATITIQLDGKPAG